MALTKQQQQLAAILKTQLATFGFNVSKYIDTAIRSGVNDIGDYAYMLIVHSPEFKSAFPGILDAQGRLRVSPQEYLSRAESFQSTAAQYGFALNKAQIGGLVQNNVDPNEFQTRAAGIQAVNTNPHILDYINQQIASINQYRSAHHQANLLKPVTSKADAVNFFTGRGDTEVYSLYEGALFRDTAKQAGLNISPSTAQQLALRTPGVLSVDEAQKRFTNIAQEVKNASPDLNSFGLSQQDLMTIEFGGPNQEALALKAEQALAQAKAGQQSNVQQQSLTTNRYDKPVLATPQPAS